MPNATHAWDQLSDETAPAYHAFRVFLELGPTRSIRKTCEKLAADRQAEKAQAPGKKARKGPTKARPKYCSVNDWARKNRWLERAASHDAYMESVRLKAATKAIETAEQRRARQRETHEVNAVKISDKLLAKAVVMLDWPLEETVMETTERRPDGQVVLVRREVHPTNWRLRDAAMMIKIAHELKAAVLGPAPVAVAAPEPFRSPDTADEGLRRALENRARLRAQLLAAPTGPPPPGGNPYPSRNGHGPNGDGPAP